MTLLPKCEKVETRFGVALTVTGVAQIAIISGRIGIFIHEVASILSLGTDLCIFIINAQSRTDCVALLQIMSLIFYVVHILNCEFICIMLGNHMEAGGENRTAAQKDAFMSKALEAFLGIIIMKIP